jgi:hypothetical protein
MARQPHLIMQNQYNPVIFLSELFSDIKYRSTDLHTPLPETIQLHLEPIKFERSWFVRPVFTPIDHYSVPRHDVNNFPLSASRTSVSLPKTRKLTLVSVVPIQSVQADHCQFVRNHVDGEICSSLKNVVILCGDIVVPDAVTAMKHDV